MANQELVDFIGKAENQGYSPGKLKEVLLEKGWDVKTVDEAIKYVNKEGIYNFPKKDVKKEVSKKETPVSIIVIAILFILEGIFIILAFSTSFYTIQNILSSIPGLTIVVSNFIIYLVALLVILGVIDILIGWGLLKLKNWARIMALVFSVIYMLTIAGIPISVIFMYFLARKKTKEAFGLV
ncbi:hypothetical protein JW949_04390 [Candidatus Woesearchaeota archaeon]|nr:hypothetical protein [Candidatus Woesearchaeota archaeon]